MLKALAAFGAPLHDLAESDQASPGVVFQIGVAPIRIDVMTRIDGVEVDEARAERMTTRFAGLPVTVLSVDQLIRNKRAAGCAQDLADLEWLEHPEKREP